MKLFRIVFLLVCISPAQALDIKVCTDENFWYPFTFKHKGKSSGLHIDIVKKALEDSDLKVSFIPLPWSRCLTAAKKGQYDAVVSASYKDKRANFLHYPDDAKIAKKSSFRISQVEYVVVTMVDDDYDYTGDMTSLPQPVRATRGYSIVDDLMQANIKVDTAKTDINNLRKLLRDKKGVVITLPEAANFVSNNERFKGQLKIHSIPLKSKSYYMPFSKLSPIEAKTRDEIWKKIALIRDDEAQIQTFIQGLSYEK